MVRVATNRCAITNVSLHKTQDRRFLDMKHTIIFDRRTFLKGAAGLLTTGVAAKLFWEYQEAWQRASAFIASAPSYDTDLETIIRRALQELGIGRDWIKDKSVMLKPNLVEPSVEAPHVNTHPAVVRAAAEVFRGWDAREVFVAEGQGHCRDTYWVLEQSGLGRMLEEEKIEFVDLNHDDVFSAPNRLGISSLRELMLPQSLRRADLVVSMPKMKTHHLAGVTLSMKNLFGVMPGICYGWPKNLLHYAGIGEAILDITAAVRPQLAILDGIVGMEGDGPIMGSPIASGVLVLGTNLLAVDATAARLMGLNPRSISYLSRASGIFGPIAEAHIGQIGERIAESSKNYALSPHL
jgi:uncharacterized protein (DUF362 family)